MLALDLLKSLDRTYAAVQLALALAATSGLGVALALLPPDPPTLRALLVGTAVLVLVLGLGMVGLLLFAGQRAAQGRGRLLHTVLAVLSLGSNPPLGTAWGLFTLWTCWSHPAAAARLAGDPAPPPDPAADERARRHHRLARRVVIGAGLLYALLAGGVLAGLGPLLAWGGEEPAVALTADTLSIGGMYGEEIPRSSIEGVQLREGLPTITLRTNGYALGGTLKGWFQTKEHGRVKLILHADQPPWLYIQRDGGLLIYGSRDPEQTRALYAQLGGG